MARRLVLAVLSAIPLAALFGAGSASAATEFGDNCTANSASSSTQATIFGLASPSSPLPLAAPSAGVITSWKLNLITPEPPMKPIPQIVPQTLKAVRVNSSAKTAQVLGEASGLVGSGANTIAARIPVQAGDRLAVFGSGPITFEGTTSEVGTLFCESSAPADMIGVVKGSAPLGSTTPFEELSEIRTPAVAVLEPDADGDGFGDETQDKCPQSASTQAPCPVVKLSVSASAKRKLAKILVTVDSAASVSVNGSVSLGKGRKAKLKGGTKTVQPGALSTFKLKFPAQLSKRLKELTKKQSLTLKATVSAPNVAAAPTTKKLKLKLKGQG
jgi:hypothetical protein